MVVWMGQRTWQELVVGQAVMRQPQGQHRTCRWGHVRGAVYPYCRLGTPSTRRPRAPHRAHSLVAAACSDKAPRPPTHVVHRALR